jgi:hypothetical protein
LFREFADLHPSAKVIGTDLSPIQPTWVPPNVQFEVDDCTDEWVHEKDSFDYIHIRGMYGSIADWDALYKTIYRSVLPPSNICYPTGSSFGFLADRNNKE